MFLIVLKKFLLYVFQYPEKIDLNYTIVVQ